MLDRASVGIAGAPLLNEVVLPGVKTRRNKATPLIAKTNAELCDVPIATIVKCAKNPCREKCLVIKATFQLVHDSKPRGNQESFQVKWFKSKFKKILNKIDGYRSRSLHGGLEFRAPMYDLSIDSSGRTTPTDVSLIGLASYSRGSILLPDEIRINVYGLHYNIRGALLKS